MAAHRGDEFVCRRIDDRKRAIVTRDHGIELKEPLDRRRGSGRAHRETIADRHKSNARLVDFGNERHVGENIGVAHVIDGGLAARFDDRATGIAEVD